MTLGQRPISGTARRILDHARRAFNERGIAAVGVRDIARELDLSPGNVSYHFPTKEALIAALVEEAHAENNAVAAPAGPLDFHALAALLRNIMQRDVENRWLTRDAVGLMLSMPTLRDQHAGMQRRREARADAVIGRLIETRMIDAARIDRTLLRLQLLTQVFFWVPAALLAAPDRDPAERLDLHLQAVLSLFLAAATPAGRRQLAQLLAGSANRART